MIGSELRDPVVKSPGRVTHKLQVLAILLVANVLASILHYGHNIAFFTDYPEPPWISPHLIDGFWFVMTPFAPLGFLLIHSGRLHLGCIVLYAYALMSLLVLGHYRFAAWSDIRVSIHVFILLEAGLALALGAYVATIQWRGGDRGRAEIA